MTLRHSNAALELSATIQIHRYCTFDYGKLATAGRQDYGETFRANQEAGIANQRISRKSFSDGESAEITSHKIAVFCSLSGLTPRGEPRKSGATRLVVYHFSVLERSLDGRVGCPIVYPPSVDAEELRTIGSSHTSGFKSELRKL